MWKPPSIYKSFCPVENYILILILLSINLVSRLQIDIEYFPYDSQNCSMKFGGWSYNGFLLDVSQLPVGSTVM